MKPTTIQFIRSCILALAVLLSGCIAGVESRPVAAPAMPQPAITAGEKVVTMVPRANLTETPPDAVTRADPASDEKARETAIANLRALLGAPELELVLKSAERSPNAANSPAVLFVDPLENRYYVSPDTLQPIEFTVERPFQETPGSPKTPDELREIAIQIAASHSSKFESMRDRLNYSEGIKGENNFFRWEVAGTNVGEMPAILQIGLKQDGTLFGYLNSLDLLP